MDLQHFAKESLGSSLVPAFSDQDIQNIAILIHCRHAQAREIAQWGSGDKVETPAAANPCDENGNRRNVLKILVPEGGVEPPREVNLARF